MANQLSAHTSALNVTGVPLEVGFGVVVATGMVVVVGAGASMFPRAVVGVCAALMSVVGTGLVGAGGRAFAGLTAVGRGRGLGFCAAGEITGENSANADRPATVAANQRERRNKAGMMAALDELS